MPDPHRTPPAPFPPLDFPTTPNPFLYLTWPVCSQSFLLTTPRLHILTGAVPAILICWFGVTLGGAISILPGPHLDEKSVNSYFYRMGCGGDFLLNSPNQNKVYCGSQ